MKRRWKGSLSQKARYRERNTGGSSLRKRDPTCPGALYDKCSVFPALEDKQEGFCRGKMSFASTFLQELRRVVPPSHSVPCSKLMHGIGWLFWFYVLSKPFLHLPLRLIFRQSRPNFINVRPAYASEIWAQLTKNLLAKSSTKRFREYIIPCSFKFVYSILILFLLTYIIKMSINKQKN